MKDSRITEHFFLGSWECSLSRSLQIDFLSSFSFPRLLLKQR
ncbi:hypothetical protein QUC31_012244 [Theobroma cacao]